MKLKCGLTWQERHEAKQEWHRWFAWHPVRVGTRDCRWLEYVERKRVVHGRGLFVMWEYEYQGIQ